MKTAALAQRKPASARPPASHSDSSDLKPDDPFCQRLRRLRAERAWSFDDLAKASGVSRSMLSQIERGRANPTLAVAARIARAFDLSLAEFVDTPGAMSPITVIRGGDRTFHYRSDPDCTIRTLSPLHLEKDVEFYEVLLREGGSLRSAPHFQGTREFLTVVRGRVRVESKKDVEVLTAGDSSTYPADVPHAIANAGRGTARVFLVVIYS